MFEEELNYEGMDTTETGMPLCSEEETEESGMTTLVKLSIFAAGAAVAGGLAWVGKKLADRKKKKTEATEEPETAEATEEADEPAEESGETETK